jgi:hypothetical protein
MEEAEAEVTMEEAEVTMAAAGSTMAAAGSTVAAAGSTMAAAASAAITAVTDIGSEAAGYLTAEDMVTAVRAGNGTTTAGITFAMGAGITAGVTAEGAVASAASTMAASTMAAAGSTMAAAVITGAVTAAEIVRDSSRHRDVTFRPLPRVVGEGRIL